MKNLNKLLENIKSSHKLRLDWFLKNKGREILRLDADPKNNGIEGKPFLFSTAKGIYKPRGELYALSFREVIGSKYEDLTPSVNEDGSWTYWYKEEGESAQQPNPKKLYTNKAAKYSMDHEIPIGVAIQVSRKPNLNKYKILGLGIISEWVDGYFVVNGFSDVGIVNITKSNDSLSKDNKFLKP